MKSKSKFRPDPKSKLMDQARQVLRYHHYAYRTEQTSCELAVRRHHALESGLQKAVKTAVDRANITKRVSSHTFRHSFATHMLENGINIRVLQKLMGHSDVKTTEIYIPVMQCDIDSLQSPLDRLSD